MKKKTACALEPFVHPFLLKINTHFSLRLASLNTLSVGSFSERNVHKGRNFCATGMQMVDLAMLLGDYNEGLIGPGSCDDFLR